MIFEHAPTTRSSLPHHPPMTASPLSPMNRRQMLGRTALGLGTLAFADLLAADSGRGEALLKPGVPGLPHFAPKAKRVITLFMSGGMSHLETFDHKPELVKRTGQELPDSSKKGRDVLLGMSGNQATFPLVGSCVPFKQHGQSGTWLSDGFPHLAKMADDLCFIRSMKSDAVNHDPAMTFMSTGAQLPGRPSMGSWLSYGLGSLNSNLPSFVVLMTKGAYDQPLSSRLWDSGFLPTQHQGVQLRAAKDPVLFLSNPAGVTDANNQRALQTLQKLQALSDAPEAALQARLEQYEMAFRMQSSIPEATDVANEPESVKSLYGPNVNAPGTFAANCLQARRLAQRGVRYIQLYQPGWDMHGNIVRSMVDHCRQVDQPAAGLLQDLKNHGLLEDTLVVFTSEFGRTCYSQGRLRGTGPGAEYGREHHRDCFTTWMAGGGVRPGTNYGETDELGFTVTRDPVHVHDLHATLLHLLGIDHERFTYRFQGRDFRLTDVAGNVVKAVLA